MSPTVIPTTVHDMQDETSPCCDAPLVLSSPPDLYECRECMEQYEFDDADDAPDTCETVKTDGDICGRELPCPYHSEG